VGKNHDHNWGILVILDNIGNGSLLPGLAAEDGSALVFRGQTLSEAVASRRGATAWSVERTTTGISELPIPTRYLGA